MSSCPHCDKNLDECLCSTKSVTSVEVEQDVFEDFSVSDSNQSYRLLVPKYKHIRLLGKGAAGAVFFSRTIDAWEACRNKVSSQKSRQRHQSSQTLSDRGTRT